MASADVPQILTMRSPIWKSESFVQFNRKQQQQRGKQCSETAIYIGSWKKVGPCSALIDSMFATNQLLGIKCWTGVVQYVLNSAQGGGHDTLANVIRNIQHIQPPMATLCSYSSQSFQICSTVISPSGWTVKAAWKCYSGILLFISMSPSGGLMMWMQEWEIYGYCRPPVCVAQSNNCQLSVINL